MRQVTFEAVQRDPVLQRVRKHARMFLTLLDARAANFLGRNAAHASSRQPARFPIQASRKARARGVCRAESRHSTYCFNSTKYWVWNVCATGLSRRRYGPVTPVAQACNAKKNFAGLFLGGARLCSCNVCRAGRLADKFPENRVVSTAVTHSLNCIVYDRNHLSTSPDRLRLVDMGARTTARRIFLTRLHLTAGDAR
jgi:hypothetical protein